MIQQLISAFVNSNLDCNSWHEDALHELALTTLECFRDIARLQVIDEDVLDAVIRDATAA